MSILVSLTHWVWAVKKVIVRDEHLNMVCNRCWRNIGRDSKFFCFVDEFQDCVPEPSMSTAGALHNLRRCQF